MFNENILFGILIVLIFTAFVNFMKKRKAVNHEMQETANKFIRTYNIFVGIVLSMTYLIGLADGSLLEFLGLDWTQNFMFVGAVITLIAILCLQNYKSKKECEYKNDERWQAIVAQVNKNLYKYHDFLIVLTSLALVIPIVLFTDRITWYIHYERVITIIFFVLSSRNIIELIQLRIYDKTM